MVFLLTGCYGTGSVPDDSVATAEGDADTDTDTDTEPDTGPGQVFDPAAPALTVTFDGTTWATDGGYWFGSEDFSSIRGEKALDATTSESFTLLTRGDIHHAGSFPVTSVEYVQQLSQAGDVFHYSVLDPSGVRLVVEGFAEGDQLFGHLDGSASLTDNVGGGHLTATELVVVGWPIR